MKPKDYEVIKYSISNFWDTYKIKKTTQNPANNFIKEFCGKKSQSLVSYVKLFKLLKTFKSRQKVSTLSSGCQPCILDSWLVGLAKPQQHQPADIRRHAANAASKCCSLWARLCVIDRVNCCEPVRKSECTWNNRFVTIYASAWQAVLQAMQLIHKTACFLRPQHFKVCCVFSCFWNN